MSKNFLVDINLNKFQLLNAVIQVLTTAPASPTAGQIYYSSTDQTFYGFNGTSWLNLGNQGAGECNLSFSSDATTVTVISSTGTDATLTSATTSAAGVMSAADKTKLDGIAAGATANLGTVTSVSVDSGTGISVTGSPITNSGTVAITNTAPNATHTGEVTGSSNLTIAAGVVTNAKLADVATNTIKGRNAAGSGSTSDLTPVQVRAMLNVADGATANTGTVTSVAATAGTGISVTGSPVTTSGTLTITNTAPHVATNLSEGTRTSTTVPINSSTGSAASLTAATASLAGVMTAADKTKLDGIETGATADQLAADVPFNNTSSGLTATNVQTAIDEIKTYADNLVVGGFVNKGGYDASTNSPNLDSTPIGGIKNGWTYIVTVAGDFFSESVQVGDMITAKQDSPTLLTHWTIVNKNIPDIVMASETDSGLVEEATSAELTSGASTGGSGAKLFITPAKLNTYLGITGGLTSTVKYTTAIGDGTNTTITVTHNIGKQFNNTQIYQTGSPYAQVECDIECLSTTQTRFKFNVAPTTNQYTVVIIG